VSSNLNALGNHLTGASLKMCGYQHVKVSCGSRRVPLYKQCPNLADPAPGASGQTRKLNGPANPPTSTAPPSTTSSAPFPAVQGLRFVGPGPFATLLAVGTKSGRGVAHLRDQEPLQTWPKHASHWQVDDLTNPAASRGTSSISGEQYIHRRKQALLPLEEARQMRTVASQPSEADF
jgi:hypothetical protein